MRGQALRPFLCLGSMHYGSNSRVSLPMSYASLLPWGPLSSLDYLSLASSARST